LKQVKNIELKIELLKLVKDRLNNQKYSGIRYGICFMLRSVVDSSVGTARWNKDRLAARDDILNYIEKALGKHAYLEGWQHGAYRRRARLAKRPKSDTGTQSYLDRIQWVEWMIEQYKQIDKEQKACK
jgi:hypothetical protein